MPEDQLNSATGSLEEFLSHMWQSYIDVTPQAAAIQDLFLKEERQVVNDHIALRTIQQSPISIDRFEPHILALGYSHLDSYEFPEKKLQARSYVHEHENAPLIFFSELQLETFSKEFKNVFTNICENIDENAIGLPALYRGILWPTIASADYKMLAHESEYGSWLATMGLRANHFTVSVRHLKNTHTMEDVVDKVQSAGYKMNTAGGVLKGELKDLLVQASTLADSCDYTFADGVTLTIPTCYYEFALRYEDASGKIFKGFIPKSADKIFESTSAKQ